MCRFLLARLTLDSLVGHITRKAIKRALDNLSRGSGTLDSAYDETMKRIEDQHPARRDLAKTTLLWITHSQRLLSVAELQQAVAIELGESDLDSDSMVECDEILSACAGLVTRDSDIGVSNSIHYHSHHLTGRRDILRLVHYTTKEYLERTKTMYFPKAQEYLASSCLTYLLFDIFSGALCSLSDPSEDRAEHEWLEAKASLCFGCKLCWAAEQHECESWQVDAFDANLCWNARDKEYPFYAYAAWYWGYHTENCDDEAIRVLTERFLNDQNRVSGALHFVGEYGKDYRWRDAFERADSNPGSAMQLAAFLGLTKIMSEMLENGFDPDLRDRFGSTPLFWAAYRGHEDIVRLLMTREEVDPNVRSRSGGTPLMVAVVKKQIAIVLLLLAYETVDINAKDEVPGRSALHYAVSWRSQQLQIMELLLARDNINVNLKDNKGRTPLMIAVEKRNEDAIRLLLAHRDIQVNERDNEGRTALYSAAGPSWIEGVRLLLARKDIQVNVRDNNGSTALHIAIVNLKYDALFGAKRNASDTPNIDVARLFLARGDVDVNIRDVHGCSLLLLHHAVCSGQPDLVQLLLTREDLEISVEDGEVGRLISVAAEELRDEEWEDKRVAIIILLRSFSEQRSSNTTSANLRQWNPEDLAHTINDSNGQEEEEEDNGDAAHRTNNVEVTEEWMLD